MKISQELEKIHNVIKPNKTLNFLFPLTGYVRTDFDPYLVNAYIGDRGLFDWDWSSPDIFILTKYDKSKEFMKMEKAIETNKYFLTSYDLFNGTYIMFVFRISPSFKSDFDKFLEGKYSEFSDPAKIRLMRDRSPKSAMPLILDKDKSLKLHWETKIGVELDDNAEVWPIYNEDDEYFNRDEFKKLMNIVDI